MNGLNTNVEQNIPEVKILLKYRKEGLKFHILFFIQYVQYIMFQVPSCSSFNFIYPVAVA